MRELGRLLLFCAVAFFTVAAAVFISNRSLLAPAERLYLQWRYRDVAENTDRVWIARPNQDRWVGVSGFPSRTEFYFPLPGRAGIRAGELHLDLETQLAEVGDGRVSITINDRVVGEHVILSGRRQQHLRFDLHLEELQTNSLRVSLYAVGSTGGGQICPVGTVNAGSAVAVLASSGLSLELDRPISEMVERIAALPSPLAIAFPADAREQSHAVWSYAFLSRRKLPVRFMQEPGTQGVSLQREATTDFIDRGNALEVGGEAGVRALLNIRAPHKQLRAINSWPVSIDSLTDDILTRPFRGSRRWNIPFTIADLPMGQAPASARLLIRTSRTATGSAWIARVSLNGNLLSSLSLPSSEDVHTLTVPLPENLQGFQNDLEVTLIDGSPQHDICSPRQDAEAQLLPESALIADPAGDSDNLKFEVTKALWRSQAINLVQDGIFANAASAVHSAALLSKILPLRQSITFDKDESVKLTFIAASPELMRKLKQTPEAIVMFNDPTDRIDGVTLRRVSSLKEEGFAPEVSLVLLIELAHDKSR